MINVLDQEFTFYLKTKKLGERTFKQHLERYRILKAASSTLEEEDIKKFLFNDLSKLKNASINKYISTIHHYCEFAEITWNKPLKRLPEEIPPIVTLSDKEIEAVINLDPPPSVFGMFFMCLAYTGARPGEIIKLRYPDDVDMAQLALVLRQTKTGQGRIIPLIEPLKSVFLSYVRHIRAGYLFPYNNTNDKHILGNHYMHNWKQRLKTLGITKNVNVYSLRHSFITNSLGNGAGLFDIQGMVGHKKADTTKRYYHGNLDLMRKAAQKLPLAKKNTDPEVLVAQMEHLIDEFLGEDKRFNKEELLEAKKHLYRSIKKDLVNK